jgi:hypothetical protein
MQVVGAVALIRQHQAVLLQPAEQVAVEMVVCV